MPELAIKIDNWSICNQDDNPYQAPEVKKDCLRGKVYGHPDHADGEYIITSVILEADGQYARTRNNLYILSNIDPRYLEWLENNDMGYNPSNPIKQ